MLYERPQKTAWNYKQTKTLSNYLFYYYIIHFMSIPTHNTLDGK